MSALIQGNFVGKAVSVALAKNKKAQTELKIEMEISGGEHSGQRLTFSGLFTDKALKYTKQAMHALGWDGKALPTDPKEATAHLSKMFLGAARVAPIEVTIARWTNPDTGELREWSTIRNIGTYQAPIVPPEKSDLVDINRWLAESGDDQIPF
jgi:hypothetical protein